MSWLSERQPYQDEEDYYEDQARFAAFTRTLAQVLEESETAAIRSGVPSWVHEFISILHWSRSDTLTLNYDTLIETALDEGLTFDAKGRVRSGSVVTSFPRNEAVMFGDGRGLIEERDTFALHKLHGSVDWFAVAGDRTGATLDRFATREHRNPMLREIAVGGRDVFLVPPTSSKTGYFDNPKTRFIWRRSKEALHNADRVVLMGYSLPLTDTALARMLWMTLASGKQEIVVVNPNAEDVRSRLVALGVDRERITQFTGLSCVEAFVTQEIDAHARSVASEFIAMTSDKPVAVGWSTNFMGAIVNADFDSDSSTLHLTLDALDAPLGTIEHPVNETPSVSARKTMTVGQLRQLGTPLKIVAHHDEQQWTVAARLPDLRDAPDWILLVPAGTMMRRGDGQDR